MPVAAMEALCSNTPPFQGARERARALEEGGIPLGSIFSAEETCPQEGSWGCVIEIPLPEKKKEVTSFSRDPQAWVSAKMKKGAELKWGQIPPERIADFQKAKGKELGNWTRERAVRLAEKHVPHDRVVRMRWIFTTKADGSAKARIVLIGFEDPDLGEIPTTSPTMSRRTRGLFLTACAIRKWTALKGDVRGAFLQGQESEKERGLFAKPVKELLEALGGTEGQYVQVLKACYGLANAPAQWHMSVSDTMSKAGFVQLQTEPCCWRLMDNSDPDGPTLIGLACAHVDDFLFAGEANHPDYQKALNILYKTYSWSDWESDVYMHCGVQVIQNQDGSTVLNHSEYCSTIEQINFQSRHDDQAITEGEKQQLRGVLGSLQWRAYQTGPQHGARLSSLQSQLASPTVATLRDTNKLVREVYAGRHIPLNQKLHVEDLEQVTFVAWSDAAVGNRRDHSSSGGYIVAASEPGIACGKAAPLNLISWKSGKLPRIARSSLAAEIQALSIAEEELMFTRLQWLEMIGYDVPMKDPASIVQKSPGIMVTDAKSLYDIIKKGVQNTSGLGLKEKYSVLDMLSVFQRLAKCRTETRWVHSEAQLADAMTKHVPGSSLIRCLQNGTWTLVHDPNFTSAKKLRRMKSHASAEEFGVSESAVILEAEPPLHVLFIHGQGGA